MIQAFTHVSDIALVTFPAYDKGTEVNARAKAAEELEASAKQLTLDKLNLVEKSLKN